MSEVMILAREINGSPVRQRGNDGYVNATELCKAAGKLWGDYRRNKVTAEFLEELAGSMEIPMDLLIETIGNGPNELRGTWVHPDVALNLAQWLSPKFNVQVSRWVRELMSKGAVSIKTGDAVLDSMAVCRGLVDSVVSLRHRQLAIERRVEVAEVAAETAQSAAEAAHGVAVAALCQAANNHGYFQVIGWARLCGRELTEGQASRHGRGLSAYCREHGYEIRDQTHPRYGHVHLYPETALRTYFADWGEPPALGGG